METCMNCNNTVEITVWSYVPKKATNVMGMICLKCYTEELDSIKMHIEHETAKLAMMAKATFERPIDKKPIVTFQF